MKIPTALIDKISLEIKNDFRFTHLKENQKAKLLKRLIELWMFILNRQINDVKSPSLRFYTNINVADFRGFKIRFDKVIYYHTTLFEVLGEIIECNETYSAGNFSRGWRVQTDFLGGTNMTEIEIDLEKVFGKIRTKEYWTKLHPNHKGLIESAYNTEINLDGYLKWLLENRGIELGPKYNKASGFIERRFLSDERIYAYFIKAFKISVGDLWFATSDSGRFYSSITNLPKSALNYLKLYGEPTVSFDLKNCQPLLLSTLIDDDNFKKDCEAGIFYQKVLNALSLTESASLDKQQIKLRLYKWLLFNPKPLKSGSLYDCIEKLYPLLISKINHLKETNDLPYVLQKKESDIFIKKLGSINVPKIIRHDEVICSKSNEHLLKSSLVKILMANQINIKYNF